MENTKIGRKQGEIVVKSRGEIKFPSQGEMYTFRGKGGKIKNVVQQTKKGHQKFLRIETEIVFGKGEVVKIFVGV